MEVERVEAGVEVAAVFLVPDEDERWATVAQVAVERAMARKAWMRQRATLVRPRRRIVRQG